MEKLQIALEKARANRLAQGGEPIRDASGHAVDGKSVPGEHLDALWAALPEMAVDPVVLDKNRIVSYKAGGGSSFYDILRTKLRDECRQHGLKRVAVTSPRPQAGKSTTVVNLAYSLARLPQFRTVVFDFDMRRPTLHKLLGQTPVSNLGAVLRGEVAFEDHFQRLGPGLAIGLNDQAVPHSAELLQSTQTVDMLQAIEDTYQPDLMLFDMPPFLATDDTQGFLELVDGVVVIVEAERTTKGQLDAVEQKLAERTKVVGVVLNKCPFPDENDAGSYGYGGYGYGYGYY